MQTGRLFVVATPIGNLDDMSARAVRVLGAVGLIAAEDTRHSKRLLDRLGIRTPLVSYHEHNEAERANELVRKLLDGHDIALITDAGTPCIADPGHRLVRAARHNGISVEAVPGPSAVIAALSISGLPTDRFSFIGFFPRKKKDAVPILENARVLGGTTIAYESPVRLCATLTMLAEILPGAEICVARELTKVHEELVRGTPASVLRHYEENSPKGECVVLIHCPPTVTPDLPDDAIRKAVNDAMAAHDLTRRDAVRMVAASLGIPRNRVYDAAGGA